MGDDKYEQDRFTSEAPPTDAVAGGFGFLSPLERKLDAAIDSGGVLDFDELDFDAVKPLPSPDDAPESWSALAALRSPERKRTPMCTGLLDYCDSALDLVAHASEDEFPPADADGLDLENAVLNALRYRDRDGGAPVWAEYRRMCLAALAILHREITGDPPPPSLDEDPPSLAKLLYQYNEALADVARVSWYGNQKHNPGERLHHAREKSTDHEDCAVRHLTDNMLDPGGYDGPFRHAAALVWRCLILTQIKLELSGARKARGAR